MDVIEYEDIDGVSPFHRWYAGLTEDVRSRIASVIIRLRGGNLQAAKSVGSGVLELRLDFGPGYRVYFGRDGEHLVILLGGGSKNVGNSTLRRHKSFGGNTSWLNAKE